MELANKKYTIQVPVKRPKGNPVRIRDGPAAVIGDERCKDVTGMFHAGKTQLVG